MKIGILTTHSALNCGAILQAFALQTCLERMGHEVEFINLNGKEKKTIRDYIGKSILKTWYKWENLFQAWKFQKNGTFGSILKKGEPTYYSLNQLQNNPPKYDVYIAGSDQIWNIGASATSINRHFYLDFGSPHTKRIAFAASLGQCIVPSSFENEIRSLLLKFDAISVREANGVEFIRSLLGDKKEVQHISDPTVLLRASDYIKIAATNKIGISSSYIASYILAQFNEEQFQIVDYIKTKINAEIINLRNPDTCIRLANANNKVVTPPQWLNYIYNAKFVICCSFHAVVFSLIFHKPFVVITPYENQRIISLLNPLGLTERILSSFDKDHTEYVLEKQINWTIVDQMIEIEKKKSILFLQNSLS